MDEQEPIADSAIRVQLANLPEILAEYIAQLLQQQSDVKLLGRVQGNLKLLLTTGPETDVLVLGAEQVYPPPGICSHLLHEFPHLRIIVLAGDQATVYWFGQLHRKIGPVPNADKLLTSIRQVYHLDLM